MAITNSYPSSSKRPFSDVEVEVEVVGGNKKKRNLYQVFISHRGPETKHLLAHYMYDVLKLKGFEVFLDIREMETGEDIPHQISEAISTSAVQIVIISRGFGESVWCLKELVMMMQKRRDGSSLVIPVFYEMEPSDLKLCKDGVPFCDRFHNKHLGRQSHETMEEWKKALKELADLSGLPWDKHKGKLVELLVKRVCDHTHYAHLHIPRHVIGIEKKLDETMEDIMKPQGKVTVVSITGIGGIGKTTFAKALFNNMCSLFERHCFVDDVKGLFDENGIVHIQKLLLEGLLNLDIPISNSGNGQYELKNRLVNQKVLLVLDNIDGTMRLNDIFLEDFAILHPSSIIIITSRVTCVFKNRYKNIQVEIPKLDFEKSERLFCSQVFGDDESKFQGKHHMLVRQIVQKCDGIPLALVLFGRHISVLDTSRWTDFLEMYRDSLPSDLLDCLQITYDSLDDLQKRLFLDVAIFFHGEEVSLVRNLWDGHASEFNISLDVLKQKLLIGVTLEDRFIMHDILRDLGRAIVDNEDKWNPGCWSRLWRKRDIISVLSEGRGTDKVEALSLVSNGTVIWDADEDGKPCPWKVDAFSTMPSLKMLFLQGKCIEGDLTKLPNGLQFLRWFFFLYDTISIPLKSVKVVDFSYGRQKCLQHLRSMEAPMKLRELRLSACWDLREIFWDRNFSLLKHLHLCYCSTLWSISHNFLNLERLECLKLKYCNRLESLPVELGRLNLKVLEISHCQNIKELPESFCQLRHLQKLFLVACILEMLPESFCQLTNLQELDLSHNRELKKLPESFGKLNGLEVLNLQGCNSLKRLPESIGQLKRLRKLSLEWCSELKKLPEKFGQLKNLHSKFSLYRCTKLKKLPESFGDLQQLQNLHLDYCTSLEMLPESLGQLTNLKNLSLLRCKELKMLPDSFGQLTNLQELRLCDTGLKTLPDSFGQLINLQKLDLSCNKELKKLPNSFGKLHGLEVLNMDRCINLEMLPDSFGQLKNLHSKFSLYRCTKLKKLPESFGGLQQLHILDLNYCTSLEMLPESLGQLTNLQNLSLLGCKELKMLPDSFGQLTNLRVLEINGCIMKTTHVRWPQGFPEAWPIKKLVLMEDSPESRPVLPREAINHSKKRNKMSCVLNNHLPSNSYRWLKELPLYPITIMEGYMSDLLPCFKVKDELTRTGGAIHKCLFCSLKPTPSSSKTWVVEGEHCKVKCIGAAICFDLFSNAFSGRNVEVMNVFRFGCSKWDPIFYTTGGGIGLFCMAVYDSLEEISLDKMSVCIPDEDESLQIRAGWVCYFLEKDEDLLQHARDSFAMICKAGCELDGNFSRHLRFWPSEMGPIF